MVVLEPGERPEDKDKEENRLPYSLGTNGWYQVESVCLCLFGFRAHKFTPSFNFLRALEEVRIAYSEAD